jgi:hypothetical protein
VKEKLRTSSKPSEPAKVDAYIRKLRHPLKDAVEALRQIILSSDKQVGEEIKWNAPTFFYSGDMKPSDPKEYRRYIVVFNLYRRDCVRLVFPSGAKIGDRTGLLQGDYPDGRRLAFFSSLEQVKSKKKSMQAAIKKWLALLER